MGKSLRSRFFLILATIVASILLTFPLEKHINLGLDLKGGMHVVLHVKNETLPPASQEDAVLKAIEIIRNRIDSVGVGETVIQRQGTNQILVQLPGLTNREEALDLFKRVAKLEFRVAVDDPAKTRDAIASGTAPEGTILKKIKKDGDEVGTPILLEDNVIMTGESISDARVDFNSQQGGAPIISLSFNAEGAKKFGDITTANVGKRLAIILDGEVLSAPNINEPILGGKAQITGRFKFEEASMLSLALRSGNLPAEIEVEEERTIGPLLGKDSIHAGIQAAIMGAIMIIVFMGIYYLQAGMISNVGLLLHFLFIFGSMGLLNILLPEAQLTLTLPGIAGIILTIGMSVDANVLINERIREELHNGQPMSAAINCGFDRALRAIIDSNVTSLIAAFILFQFGSGPIKGFAVTLTLGILTGLFASIFVVRTIFVFAVRSNLIKDKLPMLEFFHKPNIDFISKRNIFITISLLLTIASIATLIHKKDSAYGIDFSGGQIQEYKFAKAVPADVLRNVLEKENIKDVVIQQFDKNPEGVIIRSKEETYEKVVKAFKDGIPDNSFETMRIEKVGPVVGKQLRKAATLAVICAMIGILFYVAFRFKHWDFAAAGIIALIHDVIMALGVLIFMGREIDLLVITALLTIAGYSINDTIIIYDRIRENIPNMRKKTLAEIINTSINQTFGRTMLTTGLTLLSVIALYVWGGEVLHSFALCLLVGFLSGAYSTVFIAAPLVLAWEKKSK